MTDQQWDRLLTRIGKLDIVYSDTEAGVAHITNQKNGHTHRTTLTTCDCPDHMGHKGGSYDGWCKHIWARRLSTWCPRCHKTMWVDHDDNFACGGCDWTIMGGLIRKNRANRSVVSKVA